MNILCELWDKEDLTFDDLSDGLENVEELEDEPELRRWIKRAKKSGQLYFYEFKETENWSTGDWAIYRTWIPIASIQEGREMNQLGSFELLDYSAIRLDSGRKGKPYKIIK